jgi:bifunctional UDP-N-acetylglucosamine pyrophosphorylase/glucosamine-1-phosphate N-acetyltransferase
MTPQGGSADPNAHSPLAVVILAAGKGTRMKSGRAKVLHEICGWPMLGYSIELAEALAPERRVVVIGRDAEKVREAFGGRAEWVLQDPQRGTGDAVLQTRQALQGFRGDVLILYGDTPLLRQETVLRLRELKRSRRADLAMLTAPAPLPGRIVRGPDGRVLRIVETTDATPEELAIQEGNTGVYLVGSELLWKGLDQLDDRNAQGELYLTDIVGGAAAAGLRVEALLLDDADEALGINTRAELARAAAIQRRRINERHLAAGVTLVDPATTYLDVDVEIGPDTLIEPGCVIQGPSRLGARVHVKPYCVIESSQLDDDVTVGPCAHLRPGTRLRRGARVGNFVEVKNTDFGEGAKADHLSYIGDADVGAGASFGCGSITVNYDGRDKHRTTVDAGAFVGCNSNLIAPVRVGEQAYVAAGSTVTHDVPPGALGVARARQRNVEGWRERRNRRRTEE